MLMELPDTQYAPAEGARLAYQVYGEGPVDLVALGGPAGHLEVAWENAEATRYCERIGSFARVIRIDRRGTGLSDPLGAVPTLEQQVEDIAAVMDAVGVEQAALLGEGEAGRLCALFAATMPARTSALVLYGTSASGAAVLTPERQHALLDVIDRHWGEGALLPLWAPSKVGDPAFQRWWRRFESASVSPAGARVLLAMTVASDVRDELPKIRVPTLVLHRRRDTLVPVELGRELAELIPGARFVELPGQDNLIFVGDIDPLLDELEQFLTRAARRVPRRGQASLNGGHARGDQEQSVRRRAP